MARQHDRLTVEGMTRVDAEPDVDLTMFDHGDRVVPGAVANVDQLHVTFRRGGRALRALRGVSLGLGRGEIVGLVGESGSGKSVLGLSMLGLLPTTPPPEISGTVIVEGVGILQAAGAQQRALRRRYLGAVFQDP